MIERKYLGGVLLMLIAMTFIPASLSVAQNRSHETRRAEKFIMLARRAREKVGELIEFIEEIKDGIEIPENITVFLDEGISKLNAAEAELNVSAAKEAMVIFRKLFGRLHSLLGAAGVDAESGERGRGLLVAIDRAYERIDRINSTKEQMIKKIEKPVPEDVQTYLDWVEGNLTEAEADLNEAKTALELDPPKVEWAAGNLTEANRNISEAFAALRLIAGWTNSWRVESFLMGVIRFRERTRERMEQANRREINVTALLELLGYTDEDGDGKIIDDFLRSLKDLIDRAREKRNEVKNVVEDLKTLKERLMEVHRELAKEMKGGLRGRGRGRSP